MIIFNTRFILALSFVIHDPMNTVVIKNIVERSWHILQCGKTQHTMKYIICGIVQQTLKTFFNTKYKRIQSNSTLQSHLQDAKR